MNPMLMAQLQQLWVAGVTVGQQAVALEIAGNAAAAAQAYAQSAEQLRLSIMLASTNGVYVPEALHAQHAIAHMGSARARVAMGQVLDASAHFQLAHAALERAIAMNGNVPAWHGAAGGILMALGNLVEAERAFGEVQRIAPGEPTSRAMLEQLKAMRGAGGGWGVSMPPPSPAFGPAAGMMAGAGLGAAGMGRAGGDWAKMVKDITGTIDAVMGTMAKFQDLSKPFS